MCISSLARCTFRKWSIASEMKSCQEEPHAKAAIIVDTAAAHFEEDNDNDNVQAGNHARRLRSLCGLPGGPCVLVLCHPTKNAQDDNLVPQGRRSVSE